MEIDSFRKYSIPEGVTETPLAKVFKMGVRSTPERPGRELHVAYDKRQPLIEGFEAEYVY